MNLFSDLSVTNPKPAQAPGSQMCKCVALLLLFSCFITVNKMSFGFELSEKI